MLTATVDPNSTRPTSSAMSSDEAAKYPHYVAIGRRVVTAENSLRNAYTNITTVVQSVGGSANMPIKLLQSYNDTRGKLIEAAQDWLAARDATPDKYLPDAGKQPVPPPAFVLPTGVSGGLGATGSGTVPATAVQVVYGPVNDQKTVSLGDPLAANVWPTSHADSSGLEGPELVLLALFFVAVVEYGFALMIQSWRAADVEVNRTRAHIADVQAKQVEIVTQNLVNLYTKCAGNSADANKRIKCLDAASAATSRATDALPDAPKVQFKKNTFLEIAGAVLISALVAVGGYVVYKRRKNKGGSSDGYEDAATEVGPSRRQSRRPTPREMRPRTAQMGRTDWSGHRRSRPARHSRRSQGRHRSSRGRATIHGDLRY